MTSKKTAYSKFCRWYRTYLAQEIVSAYKYVQSLSLKILTTFEHLRNLGEDWKQENAGSDDDDVSITPDAS